MSGSIQIGDFRISACEHGGYWLARLDGEGMQMLPGRSLDEFLSLIDEFFKQHM